MNCPFSRSLSVLFVALILSAFAYHQAQADNDSANWMADPETGCKLWVSNPAPTQSITWAGGCVDGKAEGQGVAIYIRDGKETGRYQGECKGGKRHGKGTYIWTNGNTYEGEYEDGKRHGPGVFTWANGNKYQGDYKRGKRVGKGLFIWGKNPNLTAFVYNEETPQNDPGWMTDPQNGCKVWTARLEPNQSATWSGECANGKAEGNGTLVLFRDGKEIGRHEGGFMNGKRNGNGVFTFGEGTKWSGCRYEGYWKDDKVDGQVRNVSAKACHFEDDLDKIEF
ncbi:MAG: hypothetical protein HQK60_05595 [Deltaproteobacteria bacterium]|nr:hypothetical protein [Deltaproteobacteria bacterium]